MRQADRLVGIYGQRQGSRSRELRYSYPEYVYFRDHSKSFESLAAHYSTSPLSVVDQGDSKEARGAVVSANYFPMLGVRPSLGRFFLPEEDQVPDRNQVAVISFDYWQGRFGGDTQIIGRRVRINAIDFQIIGVTPPDFDGVLIGSPNDIWIPTMMLRAGYRWCNGFTADCDFLSVMGRLAPGQTVTTAQAELSTLAAQLATAYPATNEDKRVLVFPAIGVSPDSREEFRYQMQLLMAVAGLLLLIACANVAGLWLVRGAARQKEIALRLCLGAGRARLVRQLLTESLLLALAGGVLGVILSFWGKDLLMALLVADSEGYRHAYDVSLNSRVLIYSCVLSLITGLLFGLVPALQSSRQDLTNALKRGDNRSGTSHQRLGGGLVVAQIAVSLILLAGAALLVRSAANVQKGMNFDSEHVALMRLRPRLVQYTPEKAQAFTRDVVRRLSALPGVESVSLAKGGGFAWLESNDVSVALPGQIPDRPENEFHVDYHEIAPRFFETLKIPLIEGRDFDDRDRPDSPRVVIINETLARRLWPNHSSLDQVTMVENHPYRVVGVFKDSRLRNALESPLPFLYVPYWQNNFEPQIDSRLVVRVLGDPKEMLPTLRREVVAVDEKVPISEDLPMAEQVRGHYKPVILASRVVTCAGLIALFLTAIGLYGVLAFAVTQRTREIGIRMALGAKRADILRMVVRNGIGLTVVGLGVGLVGVFGLTRFVASLLFGVAPTDVLTIVSASVVLMAAALIASYVPARRATKVNPVVSLRYE